MKYESRIVSLMITCSLAWSTLAFSPSLSVTRWNHDHMQVWTHEKRQQVQEYHHQTARTHQDAFRLMNSYLDSLGSATVDSSSGSSTVKQGVNSFHPQRGQQPASKPNIGTGVIEATATVVPSTEGQTSFAPNQNVQTQYFPPPQQPMQHPEVAQYSQQQQTQSPIPNVGVPPPPQSFQQQQQQQQQQGNNVQQPIPPNHEVGHFNQPQPISSQLPPIPPNVPIPQPPELQPPPSAENFDPHGPNFGTGTRQAYAQPPPMQQQQPPMQLPPMQQTQQSYPQGATSYPQGNIAPPPYQQQQQQPMQQQPMQQQPETQPNQVYQPQPPTTTYANGGNAAPQMQQQQQQQQQQQVPPNQVQTQAQVFDPSTGSFPQQNFPVQGPPLSDLNGQSVQQQQQQPQYGSFGQPNPNVAVPPTAGASWGTPTTTQPTPNTQQAMAQQPPQPQTQTPPRTQFDPHELMSEQRPNIHGGSWYDPHMRNPNRKFDNVHPWERDNNPQTLPPRNQQPVAQSQQAQPSFDPHSTGWDRPMVGTPAAAAAAVGGTINLQGNSWHNDPNNWQGSQGLPYQNHPMNPLAAGIPPVAAMAPPPIVQPMNQPKRQPFDPHNPDWTRPLSSEIQGESRNTWQNHLGVPRVMVDLYSEGRPIDSEIELWQGPSNTPHKIKMYSEDGGIRPFKAVVETPGYGSSIDIKNSGPTAFPIQANVQPLPFRYEPERFKQVQGENSLYTVSLSDYATSALVTLETDGMPLMVQVELWQGPDNTPQKVRVYNEQGVPFQLMVETPGPQCTIAIRNVGPLEFPLYCAVSARVD